jgi:hypothetical protein
LDRANWVDELMDAVAAVGWTGLAPASFSGSGGRAAGRVGAVPPRRLVTAVAGLLAIVAGVPAAADDDQKVTIIGGADQSGHNYEWTVTNHHDSPIVAIEFRHFEVDLFSVPDNWSSQGSEVVGNKPGVCRASAVPPYGGLDAGESMVLQARVGPGGAHRGSGPVTVTFADGTTFTVADVNLPIREPVKGRYIRLVGSVVLGVLFLAALAAHQRRRRRAEGGPPSAAPE